MARFGFSWRPTITSAEEHVIILENEREIAKAQEIVRREGVGFVWFLQEITVYSADNITATINFSEINNAGKK